MSKKILKTISLKHLLIDGEKMIGIQFYADKLIQLVIKNLDGVKWSNEYSMAYVKNNKKNLSAIFEGFKEVAWVNCKYFFKDKPINMNIPETNYSKLKHKKSKYKRKCPDEYIDKLQVLRYSKNTVNTYVSMFNEFINYYLDIDLMNINENDIREYLKHIVSVGKSASYQNQAINAIKFYYEIVLGLPNRYYHVERPRKVETLPLVLSVEEVQRLLNTVTNLKHKAILITIYSAGLRVSEVLELKMSDIQSDRMLILVRNSKGNKDRTTLLGKKTLSLLREYYIEYKPETYLFEGQNGGKYSSTSIQKILKKALKKAKIIKPTFICHSFIRKGNQFKVYPSFIRAFIL